MLCTIIGIDAGTYQSGLLVLQNGRIVHAENVNNRKLFPLILKYIGPGVVVIEDVRPYETKFSLQTIETCKYIGELCFRLKSAGIRYILHPRSRVKHWVFNKYPEMATERINKRIKYKSDRNVRLGKKPLITKAGTLKEATFIWVDDRIVEEAMRIYWKIQKPKPGQKVAHGLNKHSWQALAIATWFVDNSCYKFQSHF